MTESDQPLRWPTGVSSGRRLILPALPTACRCAPPRQALPLSHLHRLARHDPCPEDTEFPPQLTATDALRSARMTDLVRSIADLRCLLMVRLRFAGLVGPRLDRQPP